MLIDRKLSLITMVRPLTTRVILNILVYYHSGMSSCYKTLV